MPDNTPRTTVFISYSHQDSRWLERLQVHIKPLERKGLIDRWDDTRIVAGQDWQAEIEQALGSARVAVLLVSADFLASDFIQDEELPSLLEAAEQAGATILPLVVAPCLFIDTPGLARFQALNDPAKPLSGLTKPRQEAVLRDAAKAILDAVSLPPSPKAVAKVDRRRPPARPSRPSSRPSSRPAPSTQPKPPQDPTPLTVSPDYLAWLHDKYASVELLGYDPQQGRAITLEHVYVPAVTVAEREPVAEAGRKEAPQDSARRDQEAPPPLLLERLGRQSLYLPGPPGSGKSTFCRWAVLQTGPGSAWRHPVPTPEEFPEVPPEALREHLPVLVPLREFWRHIDCGRGQSEWNRPALEQALADWLDTTLRPTGLQGGALLKHLQAGSTLLLLDGLDEVPISAPAGGHTDYPRALLLSGLQAALPAWQRAGNRVLLTSRPYGLDEAGLARLKLPRAPLEPVPEPLQQLFIQRWFHALKQAPLADELLRDLRQRPELEPLRANPMLLTALCVIYGNGKRLPQDRYELYQRIVENVLYSRYKGDAQQREPVRRRLEAIAYGMHTGEPTGTAHTTPVAEVSWREVERNLQVFANQNPAYEQGQVEPAVRREELLTRSGLLLPRDGERAAFYHLSFQEFLAAEYLSRKLWDPVALEALFAQRGAVAEWHSTLLFLFSALVVNRDPQQGLDLLGSLAARLSRDTVRKNPASASQNETPTTGRLVALQWGFFHQSGSCTLFSLRQAQPPSDHHAGS